MKQKNGARQLGDELSIATFCYQASEPTMGEVDQHHKARMSPCAIGAVACGYQVKWTSIYEIAQMYSDTWMRRRKIWGTNHDVGGGENRWVHKGHRHFGFG